MNFPYWTCWLAESPAVPEISIVCCFILLCDLLLWQTRVCPSSSIHSRSHQATKDRLFLVTCTLMSPVNGKSSQLSLASSTRPLWSVYWAWKKRAAVRVGIPIPSPIKRMTFLADFHLGHLLRASSSSASPLAIQSIPWPRIMLADGGGPSWPYSLKSPLPGKHGDAKPKQHRRIVEGRKKRNIIPAPPPPLLRMH